MTDRGTDKLHVFAINGEGRTRRSPKSPPPARRWCRYDEEDQLQDNVRRGHMAQPDHRRGGRCSSPRRTRPTSPSSSSPTPAATRSATRRSPRPAFPTSSPCPTPVRGSRASTRSTRTGPAHAEGMVVDPGDRDALAGSGDRRAVEDDDQPDVTATDNKLTRFGQKYSTGTGKCVIDARSTAGGVVPAGRPGGYRPVPCRHRFGRLSDHLEPERLPLHGVQPRRQGLPRVVQGRRRIGHGRRPGHRGRPVR